MLRLLLELNQVAATTAKRLCNVLDAVSFEVVLFADRGTLHAGEDPVKATAAGAAEEKALQEAEHVSEMQRDDLYQRCCARVKTYRGVDGLIALHVAILVNSVVNLAECDTGDTASDEAKVNGVEAVEEVRGPANSATGRSRVDVVARSRQDIVESLLPVVHIVIVDRSTLGRSRRLNGCLSRSLSRSCNRSNWGISRSRHLDGRFWVSKEAVKV